MGLFISFEGGEGSGKSTIIEKIIEQLNNAGYEVVKSREPGGTDIGKQIREVILNNKNDSMFPLCEALLFAADRAQHVLGKIKPALEEGKIVIVDRFVDSSYVYQGYVGKLGMDKVKEINQPALNGILPDLTFLLDLDPQVGLERINKDSKREKNRLDMKDLEYHQKIREGFLKLAKENKDRYYVIDASKSIDEIVTEVYAVILEKL